MKAISNIQLLFESYLQGQFTAYFHFRVCFVCINAVDSFVSLNSVAYQNSKYKERVLVLKLNILHECITIFVSCFFSGLRKYNDALWYRLSGYNYHYAGLLFYHLRVSN